MERAAAEASYEHIHKDTPWHDGTFTSWSKEWSIDHPVPLTAGVKVRVADRNLTPWDDFNINPNASPAPPVGDESGVSVRGEQQRDDHARDDDLTDPVAL